MRKDSGLTPSAGDRALLPASAVHSTQNPPIWTNNALTGINPYNLYNGGSVRASQRSQTFLAISFLLSQPDEAA